MVKDLEIVSNDLLPAFKGRIDFDPKKILNINAKKEIPFDYFSFYTSVSSVYSSKIEGEIVEADSYLKHKFLNVKYQPDYRMEMEEQPD